MITFKNVGFRYKTGPEVLHNINFELGSGSYHFLTGPSGAGKTSLLSLIYLGHLPTRGKVEMFGHDINTATRETLFKLRQNIGVVFQDYRLLNHLSAFDNVALPLRIKGSPEKEIRENVSELLDWVGLGKAKDMLPLTLSGGQQQRIAIARAVIGRPKLLLADEPTGNLDDDIGFRLMGLFEQLNKMGTTIVIATHSTQIMEQFGHSRLVLENGHVSVNTIERTPLTQKIRNA